MILYLILSAIFNYFLIFNIRTLIITLPIKLLKKINNLNTYQEKSIKFLLFSQTVKTVKLEGKRFHSTPGLKLHIFCGIIYKKKKKRNNTFQGFSIFFIVDVFAHISGKKMLLPYQKQSKNNACTIKNRKIPLNNLKPESKHESIKLKNVLPVLYRIVSYLNKTFRCSGNS